MDLDVIAHEYGTPLYVIDENKLERATKEIIESLEGIPARFAIAYPYKANPLRAICHYMHQLGWWAEVASGLEIEMAQRVGVQPNRIIFNAPFKSDTDIALAIELACKLHVDNFDEIRQIERIASKTSKKLDIGIRLSTSSGTQWDRFGFELTDEALSAVEQLLDVSNLRLVGIHGHRSSVIDLEEYRNFITDIFDFALRLRHDYNLQLEYIDIGSGFAVDEPRPAHHEFWLAPPMSAYATVISECFEQSGLSDDIVIIVEPGRRSVASCGTLLTSVTSTKSRNNKLIATVDSALNFIPGAEIYRYSIDCLRSSHGTQEALDYMLCGCLCDSLDIISSSVLLNPLQVGDVLTISNVGGYDIARSFTWQLPLPPILWLDRRGDCHFIRERSKLSESW